MGGHVRELDQCVEILKATAKDPDNVTIGAFAEAVQKLQAELALLGGQVDRIGTKIAETFDEPAEAAEQEDALPPHVPTYGP